MQNATTTKRLLNCAGRIALLCGIFYPAVRAQSQSPLVPSILTMRDSNVVAGPYNSLVLQGGIGLTKSLVGHQSVAGAQRSWSMSLWMKTEEPKTTALIAGVGHSADAFPRYLALIDGKAAFWAGGNGQGHMLSGGDVLMRGVWHALAVSVDATGTTHLYADGSEVASGVVALGASNGDLDIAPPSPWPLQQCAGHFGGLLAQVSLMAGALSADQVHAMSKVPAGLDNLPFEEASGPWPMQRRGPSGMRAPQDPATLPHSSVPPQTPQAVPPLAGNDQPSRSGSTFVMRHGWRMIDASTVNTSGTDISLIGYNSDTWFMATIPGTVLTTLIDRGVYPNPDFGLNNMAIPESLSKKSFWFRKELLAPVAMRGQHTSLRFNGINYKATIWLNGVRLGEIVGAFKHTKFDVSHILKPGERNVLAVLIEPPPHGGIAHEQSLAAGSGDNGGEMMLDGPTFGATEGWDWIPAIRDRNMGIWQDVVLTATGAVTIEVPQIITKVSLPDRKQAEVTVKIPLINASDKPIRGTVEIGFDDVRVSKAVIAPPGATSIELKPNDFKQLIIQNPRLWWPNGYGKPELHTMKLVFRAGAKLSDEREERFGMREITYQLSAFDTSGHLRRVEVSPTTSALLGQGAAIQQNGEGFRETPDGWVTSINPKMEQSPSIQDIVDKRTTPFMIILVNGIRIACKGGAWGMDDMLKRVSRERMEPFFRLHREANVNMIRNWMGQDTEDIFYDLADEYGMLIWNDFWMSTQDWNLEPADSDLLLDNARETILRYRNHPSIAIWCGRNEGVPPAVINEGLARLTSQLDGTRYYSADSNKINLHDSGPYKYQEPEDYFTKLSLGFAVEVGVVSPPTLESFQSFLPEADQWPISDDWAYHDWHQGGNGDTAPFMETINEEFGAPASLADFDRKAQMLNYEAHRAIFEGFNSKLWAPNSGRLLWMTQPAWPSTQWQIFSHDYDTQASYFGVKKAAEPIHIQMNLPSHDIMVINNTQEMLNGLQVKVGVFDLASKPLFQASKTISAEPNAPSSALTLELQEIVRKASVVLVKLELDDSNGKLLSDNFYWLAQHKSDLLPMNTMKAATLTANAVATKNAGGDRHISITLRNESEMPALAVKLTLEEAQNGQRILPAYYSDNYVNLLSGEQKTIDIAFPSTAAEGNVKVALRGWNLIPNTLNVAP